MNVFYLSSDPAAAAHDHNDRHVVKMVLESAQLLSTAHRVLTGGELPVYKATHVNHPCAKWVRESASNYRWVYRLMIELDLERQRRFTPVMGKTVRELGEFLAAPPPALADIGPTPPALAMPDDVKVPGDPVASYRACYIKYKRHLAAWKNRQPPAWYVTS